MMAKELIKKLKEIVKDGDVEVYAENPNGPRCLKVVGCDIAEDDVTDDPFVMLDTLFQGNGRSRA